MSRYGDGRPGRRSGPGGSATAYHLARHGVDVTVVERSAFPREKVCGDGLTPRGVAALLQMGIDPSEPGFERVNGLRVHSRDAIDRAAVPAAARRSPTTAWCGRGTTSTRSSLQRAQKAGARLMERTEALAPIISDGWVRGATIRAAEDKDAEPTEVRARFVIASDGAAVALRQAGRDRARRDADRSGSPRAATTGRTITPDPGSNRGSTSGRAICSCRATAGCSPWRAARSTWAPAS